MPKVAVINFWESAFKDDFLEYLFRLALGDEITYVSDINKAEIYISSVFGNTTSPPEKTIYYIGENLRPNFYKCKYALSFDGWDWNGRNFYLPLWYSRLAWPGFTYINHRDYGTHTHGYEELININDLIHPRQPISKADFEEKRFCAMIAGNPESLRINLFHFIGRHAQIDGFGRLFKNPLFQSKFNVLSRYKFSLCPENSFFPGYVTEKLFDAHFGGTVPIYYGGVKSNSEINTAAFINFADCESMDDLIEKILFLNVNLDAYNEYYCQPLLKSPPSLDDAILFLREAFDDMIS